MTQILIDRLGFQTATRFELETITGEIFRNTIEGTGKDEDIQILKDLIPILEENNTQNSNTFQRIAISITNGIDENKILAEIILLHCQDTKTDAEQMKIQELLRRLNEPEMNKIIRLMRLYDQFEA